MKIYYKTILQFAQGMSCFMAAFSILFWVFGDDHRPPTTTKAVMGTFLICVFIGAALWRLIGAASGHHSEEEKQ